MKKFIFALAAVAAIAFAGCSRGESDDNSQPGNGSGPGNDSGPKVNYKNLTYSIDGVRYKMILVDGGYLPPFYMMQTELPLSSEFEIAGVFCGALDSNSDNCITKRELRDFITKLDAATGLTFRLPRESEWKFAAQGGAKSNGYTYSGSNNIDEVAWYSGNCNRPQPVALKQPNELGFYDMSGNYEEVCINGDDLVHIDGRTFGGCWKYTASACTVTSCRDGVTGVKIPGTTVSETYAVDGKYITVRLAYSVPK